MTKKKRSPCLTASSYYVKVKLHKIDVYKRQALNEKHLERIARDPEFIALNEDLKIRDERRERKFLSLNFQ